MNDCNDSKPARIEVPWRRFSSGLWRVPENDISADYCADTFPKVKVFTHEGQLYTNCGSCYSKWVHVQVDAYPLIRADEYNGPAPQQFTYEGCEAKYGGRVFRLGPKVVFATSDPSVENGGGWLAFCMRMAECLQHIALTQNFLTSDLIQNLKMGELLELKNWLNATEKLHKHRNR